jgi:hypothetical protein
MVTDTMNRIGSVGHAKDQFDHLRIGLPWLYTYFEVLTAKAISELKKSKTDITKKFYVVKGAMEACWQKYAPIPLPSTKTITTLIRYALQVCY